MKLRMKFSTGRLVAVAVSRLVRLFDFRIIIQLCYILIVFNVLMIGINTWLLVDKQKALPTIEKTAKKIKLDWLLPQRVLRTQ